MGHQHQKMKKERSKSMQREQLTSGEGKAQYSLDGLLASELEESKREEKKQALKKLFCNKEVERQSGKGLQEMSFLLWNTLTEQCVLVHLKRE